MSVPLVLKVHFHRVLSDNLSTQSLKLTIGDRFEKVFDLLQLSQQEELWTETGPLFSNHDDDTHLKSLNAIVYVFTHCKQHISSSTAHFFIFQKSHSQTFRVQLIELFRYHGIIGNLSMLLFNESDGLTNKLFASSVLFDAIQSSLQLSSEKVPPKDEQLVDPSTNSFRNFLFSKPDNSNLESFFGTTLPAMISSNPNPIPASLSGVASAPNIDIDDEDDDDDDNHNNNNNARNPLQNDAQNDDDDDEDDDEDNALFNAVRDEVANNANLDELADAELDQNFWLTFRVMTCALLLGIQLPRQTLSYWIKAAIVVVVVAIIETLFNTVVNRFIRYVKFILLTKVPFLQRYFDLPQIPGPQQQQQQPEQAGNGNNLGAGAGAGAGEGRNIPERPGNEAGPGAASQDQRPKPGPNVAKKKLDPNLALLVKQGIPLPPPSALSERTRLSVVDTGRLVLPPKSWLDKGLRLASGFVASFIMPSWEPPKQLNIEEREKIEKWVQAKIQQIIAQANAQASKSNSEPQTPLPELPRTFSQAVTYSQTITQSSTRSRRDS